MTSRLCSLALYFSLTSAANADAPTPAARLTALFEWAEKSGDRSFVLQTHTHEKNGDRERKSSSTSSVHLIPKKDVVVINTGTLWYRSEVDSRAAWSEIDSEISVQFARPLESPAERASELATSNHAIFWFIPTSANAQYLLDNFKVKSSALAESHFSFELTLADLPGDEYWKRMKESGLDLSATLVFDAETGFPIKGEVNSVKGDYVRNYEVTAEPPSSTVPEQLAEAPKEVSEKLQKYLARKRK